MTICHVDSARIVLPHERWCIVRSDYLVVGNVLNMTAVAAGAKPGLVPVQ